MRACYLMKFVDSSKSFSLKNINIDDSIIMRSNYAFLQNERCLIVLFILTLLLLVSFLQ